MQACNVGDTFDQLFLRFFFMRFLLKMPLYFVYTMVKIKEINIEVIQLNH